MLPEKVVPLLLPKWRRGGGESCPGVGCPRATTGERRAHHGQGPAARGPTGGFTINHGGRQGRRGCPQIRPWECGSGRPHAPGGRRLRPLVAGAGRAVLRRPPDHGEGPVARKITVTLASHAAASEGGVGVEAALQLVHKILYPERFVSRAKAQIGHEQQTETSCGRWRVPRRRSCRDLLGRKRHP